MINFYCVASAMGADGVVVSWIIPRTHRNNVSIHFAANICIYIIDLHSSFASSAVCTRRVDHCWSHKWLNWWGYKAIPNWGPLSLRLDVSRFASHNIARSKKKSGARERSLRNNNVTQRFIECNKRNKYRGFFCCEIKKIYLRFEFYILSGLRCSGETFSPPANALIAFKGIHLAFLIF